MLVSIFNDVLGPVMRGPSSSHCAAALRIGRLARDLMGGKIEKVLVEFDRSGSLPTTHASQGSDMGLFGGLLGWDAADERLPGSAQALHDAGVALCFETVDVGDPHPNTYRLTLTNGTETHTLHAISTGGGMIEVIKIDGQPISLFGDREVPLDALGIPGRCLQPVLPVLTLPETSVPFKSALGMLRYDEGKETPLWKLAAAYESRRGGLTEDDVLAKALELIQILRRSIAQGIAGTHYEDRILGHQSGKFAELMQSGKLLGSGALNRIVSCESIDDPDGHPATDLRPMMSCSDDTAIGSGDTPRRNRSSRSCHHTSRHRRDRRPSTRALRRRARRRRLRPRGPAHADS